VTLTASSGRLLNAFSPELVAKLDHDFTVYAYDYSEYETPLVGQGMLSWILASASASPNAPADQSQTMVTGRVCKSILGLFSNGIKETLEVKLKLVPVPTCLQREYVENMERYHSLSKLVPEGLDYSQWAEFLKANPAIEQLACPTPEDISRSYQQFPFGGVDSIHDMLTPMPREDSFQPDMYSEQFGMSFHTQDTRASSPALSTNSYNPYFANHDSRPTSRASFHSESMAQSHHHKRMPSEVGHQQEEGPSKKRVRLTQAKRPKKTVLGANNDSLRVTASTAASVRLHRPVATNPATALASIEQVPRVPTPRPSHSVAHPQGLRPPAPSLLRHASIDEPRPYITPYEPGVFSDAAVESADDERGSPDETPTYMPSSPPLMPQRLASSAPSSPGLPTLPYPADSGFVSDVAQGRDEDEAENGNKAWEGSDLPTVSDVKTRPKLDKSNFPWKEVNPGPIELLPKSYIPKPKQYPRPAPTAPVTNNTDNKGETVQQASPNEVQTPIINGTKDQVKQTREGLVEVLRASKPDVANFGPTNQAEGEHTQHRSTTMPPLEADTESQPHQHQYMDRYQQFNPHPVPQYATAVPVQSRSTTPNPPPKRSKASKPRGLPRSQTWSVGPMSDAAGPLDGNPRQPRSGSGAKRRQNIANKLNVALDKGEMPDFCSNCGEIETPTWRKAYSRTEDGEATDVTLSTVGNGIVGFEIMVPAEGSEEGPKFRIFKNILDQEEKEGKTYKALVLCNPCGLWLNKKGAMRPIEVWGKKNNNGEKPKRKRKPAAPGSRKRAKGNDNDLKSDAIFPNSEPVHGAHGGPIDTHTLQPMDDATAQAALQRAIQSSPVGFGGSQPSPIDADPDLTPRPTRRLLFPSPRKSGEAKSLEASQLDGSQASVSPRSKPMPTIGETEVDKENFPPIDDEGEDDDLAHLFEDSAFAHKTPPSKGAPFQDLLKTPTPGSRRRIPLTPKHGTSDTSLKTPSRNILTTPRSQRTATIAPETPFTRQLNALMSDCPLSSPSQAIDFSGFPTFNTPGRVNSSSQFCDFMNDDFMSSDMPIPSSPPAGLGFSLYEDPETATVGLWSGASIFNSDPVQMNDDQQHGDVRGSASGAVENGGYATMLKINGLSADFAAMIEEVANPNRERNTNAMLVANKGVSVNVTKDEDTVETQDAILATVEEKALEVVKIETPEQETAVVESKVVDSTEVQV
jgi:hypothetical protein